MTTSIGSQAQIFIGYDEREHKAYEVCEYSLQQRSNIKINKLLVKTLKHITEIGANQCLLISHLQDSGFLR